jgi:serine/threonine protein kinase
LIVGLVTDELGMKQKRMPFLPYQERRDALEKHVAVVGGVVPHNGDSKMVAYEKLKFDILFTSDEYFQSQEHLDFEKEIIHIPTIYIPKIINCSTTDFSKRMFKRFILNLRVLRTNTRNESIYSCGENLIAKTIQIASRDKETRDNFACFHVFAEPPRNWKNRSNMSLLPMVSGINPRREIIANQRFMNRSWSTFKYATSLKRVPTESHTVVRCEDLRSVAVLMNRERSSSNNGIVWLVQQKVEFTLLEYLQKHPNPPEEDLESIVRQIRAICEDLTSAKTVHGDIHPNNLLISLSPVKVYLIDFGWVCSSDFDLCTVERDAHEQNLSQEFDWVHFVSSLESVEFHDYCKELSKKI